MNRRTDQPTGATRKVVIAGVAAVALAACSSTAGLSATVADNVKPSVDNESYIKSPALRPTASATPRPLSTERAASSKSAGNDPTPEVTVTVTAAPTMDPIADQPAVLRIPSFDVTSDVVAVGQDASGGVVVPEDVRVTGWYDRSSWIGSPLGSIVLVGHRDSAVAGAGALYGIEELQVGDSVVLASQDGEPHRFRVREIKSVEKTRFSSIVEEVFRPDSPYRLTLITCGGAFDDAAGSYLSNIIVTAYPE